MLQIEIDVIRHDQIDKTVAIVIAKSGAQLTIGLPHSGLGRDIGKGAVTIVPIKNIPAKAGDIKVGPAIIIKISDGAAHRETGMANARFFGDVGKSPIVIVVIKRAARLFTVPGHLHRRRIGEVNIQPAIAIVVEQNHPATHRFHDVFIFRRGRMFEVNAGFFSDVFQLRDGTALALSGSGPGGWWTSQCDSLGQKRTRARQ